MTALTPFGMKHPELFGDFRREMDDLMTRMFSRDGAAGTDWFSPLANVSESEDQYEVSVDLPGISPDDVHLELKHGDLWITGERKQEEEKQDQKLRVIERRYGKFQRVIRLSDDVDPDQVDAEYRDGVLRITVPKNEAAKPKRIQIRK